MGKKTKTGKQRKDEYYYQAKATGYRARAAFKLLEINQKFHFLENSNILIDLCAAPGSWLQVATKIMPIASIKIGIDLVSIESIPGCKTFEADITSDKCRQLIRDEIKTAKANVVLHDGAPNVGGNWNLDEFQQAHLCLKAFALATEFLVKNGTFVTKVFRSKDFESLRWVFTQLFQKVSVVKPKSSRLQSAEIFLVCEKYKAPHNLDPKFLDIKHVFADVNEEKELTYKVAQKMAKKATGYDGPMIKNMAVSELLEHQMPSNILLTYNKIIFDNEEIENHELTTDNIKRCCSNLTWVSKHDFDKLKLWVKKMVPFYKKLKTSNEDMSNHEEENEDANEDSESDNDDQLDKQLAEVETELKKSARQEIKKERRKKLKQIQCIQNQMLHPGDRIDQSGDIEMFSMNKDYIELFKNGTYDFEMNLEDLDDMYNGEIRLKRKNEIEKYKKDRKLIGPAREYIDKTIEKDHDYGLKVEYDDKTGNDVEDDSDEEEELLQYNSDDDENEMEYSDEDDYDEVVDKNIRSKNKVKFMDRDTFIDLLCGIDEDSENDNEEDEVEDKEDLTKEVQLRKRTYSEMEDDSSEKLDYADKLYTYIMQMATNTEKHRIKSIVESGSTEQRAALLEYARSKHVAFVDANAPQFFIEEERSFNRRPIPLDEIENIDDGDDQPKAKKKKVPRMKNKVDKSQSKKVLQAQGRRKKKTTAALNRLAKRADRELKEMTDVDTSRYMEKLEKKVSKIKTNRRHIVFNVVKHGGVTANSKNKLKGRARENAKVVLVDKRSKSDLRKKKRGGFKSNVNKRKST